MNVIVINEHRFLRTPDGAVWTQAQGAYAFWLHYRTVFAEVTVVARVQEVEQVPADWTRVDGEGVRVAPIPYYVGPRAFLLQAAQVRRAVCAAFHPGDAVILRVPSTLAGCLRPTLRRLRYPHALEVVCDPQDVFAPGAVCHPLRPLFRWWFTRELRAHCAEVTAVAYVTERALQQRYPAAHGAVTAAYSSVEMPATAYVDAPRQPVVRPSYTLLTIGSLAQMYKAPDVLIDAVAYCVQRGWNFRCIFIGDGRHRPELEARAVQAGLAERVIFKGQLRGGAAVRAELDAADLFVLPSRTEGLPRAMIEAMGRALPCIGSTAGGIPELLPPEDMVQPGDVTALANKICTVLADPARLAAMSERNLSRAQCYAEETLRARRTTFYHAVRQETERWLQTTKDLA